MDFKESTIKNYSGLSTETKPTIAAGDDVPNGSRWREVDTGATYFFNTSDDKWYEVSEAQKVLSVSPNIFDVASILNGVLKELKIMNLHLSLLTDTTIKNTEVE